MKISYIALISMVVMTAANGAAAEPPAGYYSAAIGSTGSVLKATLHKIIDGHRVVPYTNSRNHNWQDGQDLDVWEALAYTDSECPDDEPGCGRVRLLYLDDTRLLTQANRGGGENDSWDREHVWPKSRGFPNQSQDGYTDLHHLRPADRNINGIHSNYGYDNGGTIVMDKLGDGSEKPTGARIDPGQASFEPPDRAKGQVARMIFYMAVRYEVGDDGPPENMPDLFIKNDNKRVNEPWIGKLCTLVAWNNMFGPTTFERRRNDRVMHIQGNRNPFIDEPGWVNLIWGEKCS